MKIKLKILVYINQELKIWQYEKTTYLSMGAWDSFCGFLSYNAKPDFYIQTLGANKKFRFLSILSWFKDNAKVGEEHDLAEEIY